MLSRDFLKYLMIGVVLLFLFLPAFAFCFGPYQNVEVLSVKDGDTVEVRVEVYPDVFVEADVRVIGIDTPETRRGTKSGEKIPECEIELGKKSKAFAQDIIFSSEAVSLFRVDPKNTKYAGRISGDFILKRNGEHILFSEYMIQEKHAVEYTGGTRKIWPC